MIDAKRTAVALVAVVCLTAACSSRKALDDASNVGDRPMTDDARTRDDASVPAILAGTWKGYVEAHTFMSGSDAVTLVLSDATTYLAFGDGTPPSIDPDVGYPRPVTPAPIIPPDYILEGYQFSLSASQWDGTTRLRFAVHRREQWEPFCAAQTTLFEDDDRPGKYSCVPSTSGGSDPTGCYRRDSSGGKLYFDCIKILVCERFCTCTATSCSVDLTVDEIAFDLRLASNQLNGSVTLPGGVRNIFLTRQ